MAGEAKYVYGSQLTLEDSGGSAAAAAVVAANAASFNSANSSMYPLADFVLYCSFGAALAGGVTVDLFRQSLNIDGENDALDTTASTFEQTYVGSFAMKSGQSAAAYYFMASVPLTANCQFWIKNNTAQSIPAGWTLKATPKSFVPGS
jgi:hypothetical protein